MVQSAIFFISMARKETMGKRFGTSPRPVRKIDLKTNKVIKKYDSVSDASKDLNETFARTGITYCCQGKQKSAYGFKWEYAD